MCMCMDVPMWVRYVCVGVGLVFVRAHVRVLHLPQGRVVDTIGVLLQPIQVAADLKEQGPSEGKRCDYD